MMKPGDKITVTVGGVDYETCIDEKGVQRFLENPNHPLLKSCPIFHDTYTGSDHPDTNWLYMQYAQNKFTQREYAEANMALGYSVCGFCDISSFDNYAVVTPDWTRYPTVCDELEEELPRLIYKYCEANNITQQELATKLGEDEHSSVTFLFKELG